MKAQTVDVKSSSGRILCCTIFRSSGKKLLAKGHLISEDDIRILESEGMDKVWVTELEEGEIGEDDAVSTVAGEMGCGCCSSPAHPTRTTRRGSWAFLRTRGRD